MRLLTRWLAFAAFCLAASCWLRADGQPPNKKDKAAKAVAGDKSKVVAPDWTMTVQGWGKTRDDAEKHAARNAADKLLAHLRGLDPQWQWTPEIERVRKEFLEQGDPKRHADQDMVVEGEKLQCWAWTVRLSPAQLDKLRKEDASYRAQLALRKRSALAEVRMVEMGKLVAWLVLALTGAWLYLQLEQWTVRAKRRWLRFALASVVVGGGLGLWLWS